MHAFLLIFHIILFLPRGSFIKHLNYIPIHVMLPVKFEPLANFEYVTFSTEKTVNLHISKIV